MLALSHGPSASVWQRLFFGATNRLVDPGPLEFRLPFSKTEIHLHFPAQFIFDRSTAGCISLLDSTLDVVRVIAEGLVELDFDLA
jgi:hypothetical protein